MDRQGRNSQHSIRSRTLSSDRLQGMAGGEREGEGEGVRADEEKG